jgi:hypothetical protein
LKQPSSRNKPSAIERNLARRSGWLRLTRTILLGAIATFAGIFWAGDQYGIERSVMIDFMTTSALFVVLLMLSGLAGAFGLWAVRKLIKRN